MYPHSTTNQPTHCQRLVYQCLLCTHTYTQCIDDLPAYYLLPTTYNPWVYYIVHLLSVCVLVSTHIPPYARQLYSPTPMTHLKWTCFSRVSWECAYQPTHEWIFPCIDSTYVSSLSRIQTETKRKKSAESDKGKKDIWYVNTHVLDLKTQWSISTRAFHRFIHSFNWKKLRSITRGGT